MAFGHPKIERLVALLGCCYCLAVGICECLWQFVSRHAPAGDVGKWTDADIAQGMRYEGSPAELIKALLEAGLLDESDQHRLCVHDWSDHCEDSIHATLARRGDLFADGSVPKLVKLSRDERADRELHFAEKLAAQGAAEESLGRQRRKPAANGSRKPPPAACLSLSQAMPEPGKAKPEADDAFDTWWATYPKRVGKDAAQKAWANAIDRIKLSTGGTKVAAVATLLTAAREFANSPKGKAGKFCPNPSTWLNQGRWADDRSTWHDAADGADNGRIGPGQKFDPAAATGDGEVVGRW